MPFHALAPSVRFSAATTMGAAAADRVKAALLGTEGLGRDPVEMKVAVEALRCLLAVATEMLELCDDASLVPSSPFPADFRNVEQEQNMPAQTLAADSIADYKDKDPAATDRQEPMRVVSQASADTARRKGEATAAEILDFMRSIHVPRFVSPRIQRMSAPFMRPVSQEGITAIRVSAPFLPPVVENNLERLVHLTRGEDEEAEANEVREDDSVPARSSAVDSTVVSGNKNRGVADCQGPLKVVTQEPVTSPSLVQEVARCHSPHSETVDNEGRNSELWFSGPASEETWQSEEPKALPSSFVAGVLPNNPGVLKPAQPNNPSILKPASSLSRVFFNKYSDSSGYMSAALFKKMCAEKGYSGLGELQLDDAFVQLDKNQDGQIEYKEFYAWWALEGTEARRASLEFKDDAARKRAEQARSSFQAGESGVTALTSEMFRLRCYRMGYCLDDWELEEAFAKVDKDGDGHVDAVEFLRWWHADDRFSHLKRQEADDSQASYVQQVGEFFMQYDEGLSGSLSYDQFEPLYRSMVESGSLTAPIDEMYAEVDTDHDKKITFNEFIRWYTNGARWSS